MHSSTTAKIVDDNIYQFENLLGGQPILDHHELTVRGYHSTRLRDAMMRFCSGGSKKEAHLRRFEHVFGPIHIRRYEHVFGPIHAGRYLRPMYGQHAMASSSVNSMLVDTARACVVYIPPQYGKSRQASSFAVSTFSHQI